MHSEMRPSVRGQRGQSAAVGAGSLLVVIVLAWAPPALADFCPDDDSDLYADCTVPGCDPGGLLCGDCDDSDPWVNPGELDTCNHVDDDCDVEVDEGFTLVNGARKVTDPGCAAGDLLGAAVAPLGGDVNSDGVPDFVATAPHDDTAQGSDAGSALVFSGIDLSRICKGT